MNIFKRLSTFTKKLLTYSFYLIVVFVICGASLAIYNRFYYSFYYVDGNSMLPTLENLQFGMVDTHDDIFKYLERYDIVVTYYPDDYNSSGVLRSSASLKIKRVIGLPNETVYIGAYDDGTNYIEITSDGESYILELPFTPNNTSGLTAYVGRSYTIDDDQYFVMGDNWGHSSDSASVGPVDLDMIEGILIAIEGVCEVDSSGNVISLTYTETTYFK